MSTPETSPPPQPEVLRAALAGIFPLSDAAWAALAPTVTIAALARGESLVKAGEPSRHAGLVVSGLMRTFYASPEGDEVVTSFCTAGSLSCAYAAALAGLASSVTIQALQPCVLARFDVRRFRELVETDAAWSTIGRRVVEADYLAQERRLTHLLTLDAATRVQLFREECPELWATAPQRDIASFLGITRETLNRLANRRLR